MVTTYATLGFANNYFNNERLTPPIWVNADPEDRLKALTMATRSMNRLNFVGDKTAADQELEFPRGGDADIPDTIKQACCEVALWNLEYDAEKDYRVKNVIQDDIASSRMTTNPQVPMAALNTGIGSIIAWRLLLPYLQNPRIIKLSRAD